MPMEDTGQFPLGLFFIRIWCRCISAVVVVVIAVVVVGAATLTHQFLVILSKYSHSFLVSSGCAPLACRQSQYMFK